MGGPAESKLWKRGGHCSVLHPGRRRWCYLTGSPESVCYTFGQSPQLLNSWLDDLPVCSASFRWQRRRVTISPRPFWCSDSLLRRRQTLLLSVYLLFCPPFESTFRSDYDDWKPALASLLQPIPFPKEWVFTQLHVNSSALALLVFLFPSADRNWVRSLDWEETEHTRSSSKPKCLLCAISNDVNTACWDYFR